MGEYIHKSHNVSVLMYHLIFPAKYRRVVLDEQVDNILKGVRLEIEKRYEVKLWKLGTDKDHIHLPVQAVPTCSAIQIVTKIKSITAREIFKRMHESEENFMGRRILDGWSFRERSQPRW